MSSGTEKFSVVFWKMGASWQKWQRAEDCSTRARLQLRMPGRRWCVVWFAVRWAFDGRQIVVVGVLPTHQSSANHWRDTEAPIYVDNGKLEWYTDPATYTTKAASLPNSNRACDWPGCLFRIREAYRMTVRHPHSKTYMCNVLYIDT